jgi:hypothetical protein
MPRFAGKTCPGLSDKVSEDDARLFMRGLREGLYSVEPDNQFTAGFASRPGGPPRRSLFFEVSMPRHVRDETFVHYGAAAELVLDWGWDPQSVLTEHDRQITAVGPLTAGHLTFWLASDLKRIPGSVLKPKGTRRSSAT